MNRRNLNTLLGNYSGKLGEILKEESYMDQLKLAAEAFKQYVDPVNGNMIEGLMKAEEACDALFTDGAKQPYRGVIKAAQEKPEEVQALFAKLKEEDNGNLMVRQMRLTEFRQGLNRLIEESVGGMWKYEQNFRDAMTFQYLLAPEENYMFRYTDAKKLADCLENSDAVRSGKYFSLQEYYNMCREIEREIKEKKALADLLDQKQVRMSMLVAALMSDAITYSLYDNIVIRSTSKRSAMGKAAKEEEIRLRKEEMVDVQARLAVLEQELNEIKKLIEEDQKADTLEGKYFIHKKFGKGLVVEDKGQRVRLDFGGSIKAFAMPDSVVKGLLVPDEESPAVMDVQEKYQLVEKKRALETDINKLKLRREVLSKYEN